MTPDPNAGPLFPYALAAVLFVAASVVALILMADAWRRFEDWLAARHLPSNIVTFLKCEADVVRIYPRDNAS